MTPARIAYVGSCESAPRWLFAAIAQRATLEAVCGPDAETAARRHQARWTFAALAELLRESAPDGVVLVQPLDERARMVKECLAAGVGVLLLGAPGAAAACKRIHSLARVASRVVLAAPASRYMPAMMLARRQMESGKFGAPLSISVESTIRGAPRTGSSDLGPVPADQVFEAVDAVHHLVGPLRHVFATAHRDGAMAVAAITTTDVPVSIMLHASGPADAAGLSLEIRATDGGRLWIDREGRMQSRAGQRLEANHGVSLATVDPAVELGLAGLIGEFVGYFRGGAPGRGGLIGPVETVAAVAEAILSSAERGRPVTLKLETGRKSSGGAGDALAAAAMRT